MRKRLPHILVVASRTAFRRVFDYLEASGKYRLDYAPEAGLAPRFLKERTPDTVLLELPSEKQAAERTLGWLDGVKQKTVVAMISAHKDMHFYLAAMERGAFDYFTRHTPLEEITRVLDNAVRGHRRQAA